MLQKYSTIYKINYIKDLILEDSYNETKEIRKDGFSPSY